MTQATFGKPTFPGNIRKSVYKDTKLLSTIYRYLKWNNGAKVYMTAFAEKSEEMLPVTETLIVPNLIINCLLSIKQNKHKN